MAKTYPDIGTFSPGDILTAATMNEVGTNLDNQRVPPMVQVQLDSFSLASSGTAYYAAFDSTDFNAGNDVTVANGTSGTTAASAGKLTVTTAGVYLVTYNVEFGSNATGVRRVVVGVDGTINPNTPNGYGFVQSAAGNGGSTVVTGTVALSLSASSYVQIGMAQTSGGALTVNSLNAVGFLQMLWLGQAS